MTDSEPPNIREKRVAAIQQEWTQTLTSPPTPDQQKLIELGARFMTSDFGRPSNLFNKTTGENYKEFPPELDSAIYRQIPADVENHRFVADFAINQLTGRDFDQREVFQLLALIWDLDIVLGITYFDSAYQGELMGTQKLHHPDFARLRAVLTPELAERFLPPRR